ncbi:MAG: ribonuclease H-like domain-containing protein [Candidatus Peribacteraceae bacterium]|nr:ribonuclease H-like domain-containing protein [Candidatus Peribacteraceae bacterium]
MKILKTLKEKDLVFYDIETARIFDELPLDSPYFDSWAWKKRKEGVTDNKELQKTYAKESGLFPEFSKIVSIVVGRIKGDKLHTKTYDDLSEKVLLEEFNKDIGLVTAANNKTKLVGFFSSGFDTPFVQKRLIINGIEPHDIFDTFDDKPWLINDNIDLAILWKGGSYNRASLLAISTVLGLPSPKDDVKAYEVGDVYWSEGAEGLERISLYCGRDVLNTANIFRKLRFEPILELYKGVEEKLEKTPLIISLNNKGPFGAKQKKELQSILSGLDKGEDSQAVLILEAIAAKKGTKITKEYVADLKEEIYNE